MESKHCVDEDTLTSVCSDRLRNRSKMHHLTNTIYKHKNTNILVSVVGKPKKKSMETDPEDSVGPAELAMANGSKD